MQSLYLNRIATAQGRMHVPAHTFENCCCNRNGHGWLSGKSEVYFWTPYSRKLLPISADIVFVWLNHNYLYITFHSRTLESWGPITNRSDDEDTEIRTCKYVSSNS